MSNINNLPKQDNYTRIVNLVSTMCVSTIELCVQHYNETRECIPFGIEFSLRDLDINRLHDNMKDRIIDTMKLYGYHDIIWHDDTKRFSGKVDIRTGVLTPANSILTGAGYTDIPDIFKHTGKKSYLDNDEKPAPNIIDGVNLKPNKDYHLRHFNLGSAAIQMLLDQVDHKLTNGLDINKISEYINDWQAIDNAFNYITKHALCEDHKEVLTLLQSRNSDIFNKYVLFTSTLFDNISTNTQVDLKSVLNVTVIESTVCTDTTKHSKL